MGKIKSKSVRKIAKTFSRENIKFGKDFEENKKILTGLTVSKKIRNQIAGLMAKTNRQ